ncbi:MAG: hypothetical protein RL757_1876 [Bacteroidota bacterium]|jgi:starch synthase (maltosyl-transferring)
MRNRTIIENVRPQVEGGKYFIKRAVGETVEIRADIFGDGHDVLCAAVMVKADNAKKWDIYPMQARANDAWEARFYCNETGFFEYKIDAWVDQLATWHHGFLKKHEAGQHMSVELELGASWLQQTAAKYSKTEAKELVAAEKLLSDKKKYADAVAFVCSDDFHRLVEVFPMRQHVSSSPVLRLKVERSLAAFSAWYEFFPRSAASKTGEHGTLKDAIQQIPRVAELGFDVLYLPPVHPIGEVNRKGKNNAPTAEAGECGSPWAIGSQFGGHKAIEPALGTLSDYKKLIREAKKSGIEIALDLALQCAPDHPYIKSNPEWFVWRPDGTIAYAENPPKKYQDIVPLNFECEDWKNLWDELKSIVEFWVEQGISVFRVDNPHTKPIPFWEWCIAEIHKKSPDVIFLAEAFTRPKIMASLAKVGFTQGYSYYTWRVTKAEIMEYMNTLTQTESREYYRPNFWPNTPDILPFHLHNANSNMFFVRLAMAATLSSNYGVYGPVYEFLDNDSFHGKEEYNNSEKYEIKVHDWSERNRITDLMTLLNKMRKENAALQTTWNIEFSKTDNENLLSYIKKTDDNVIWCIANLDSLNTQSGFVEVPKNLLNIEGNPNLMVEDLLTGEKYNWTNDWNFVALNPFKSPIHIFKVSYL